METKTLMLSSQVQRLFVASRGKLSCSCRADVTPCQ